MAVFNANVSVDMVELTSETLAIFTDGIVTEKTASVFTGLLDDGTTAEQLSASGTFLDYVGDFPTSGTVAGAEYTLDGVSLSRSPARASASPPSPAM